MSRRLADALPATLYAYGFSWRKRAILRRFVAPARVVCVRGASALPPRAVLLLWGRGAAPAGTGSEVRIVRVEDGFLRSVGLGAELARPLSWVFDQRGIYFDATQPSDLEYLLQHAPLPPALLARAARLRERIVSAGLTKYNVGAGHWQRPADGRQVVLVVGQVERDASLQFGAPVIATNLALLRVARAAAPHAWLVYKPHPDVVAGLRAPGPDEGRVAEYCDEIVTETPMDAMLAAVDEVHVLTSLAGFEALLRGKRVVCHGLPFYAGWGLTQDMLACPRRSRRLGIDGLVAAALILYPTYMRRDGRADGVGAEQVLDDLIRWRASGGAHRWWRRLWRALLGIRERLA